jgi:uncharacterized protein YjbI with pentapeptide repeats
MSDDLAKDNDLDPMRPISALASEDELKREQLRLTVEKMRVENRKLARDLAPEKWPSKVLKNFVALGGIFTVLATGYGLFNSYNKTLDDRESARMTERRAQDVERRVRFEDAVKKLESPNVTSKLVAVSVLSGYLTANDRPFHRQILLTFASVVATEDNLLMQAAILDLMEAQDDTAIEAADWSYFQSMLVSQSRALVARGDLYRKRQFGLDTIKACDDEVAARHVGRLMTQNVRKDRVASFGAYAGIYCEACNFRYKRFPKGADFSGSILDRADFRGATLEGAIFNNAEIEGTVFALAYLKDAQFQTVPENRLNEGVGANTEDVTRTDLKTSYLQPLLPLLDSHFGFTMTMPDFSCANLQNARFDNLSLFGIAGQLRRKVASGDESRGGWRANVSEREKEAIAKGGVVSRLPLTVTPPSFYRADLKGADLGNIRAFSLRLKDDAALSQYFLKATVSENSELILWEGLMQRSALLPKPPEANAPLRPVVSGDVAAEREELLWRERTFFQNKVRYSFLDAHVSGANLPDGLMELLEKDDPQFSRKDDPQSLHLNKSRFVGVYRKHGEWDWDCPTTTTPLQ